MRNLNSFLTFAGAIGGSIAGMGTNLWNNASPIAHCPSKDEIGKGRWMGRGFCENPLLSFDFEIFGQSILSTINYFKQQELNSFPLALPYVPLIIDISLTSFSKAHQKGISSGFNELKHRLTHLPYRKLLAPFIISGISALVTPYFGRFLSDQNLDFRPSIPVIHKLSAAMALYASNKAIVEHVEKSQGSKKRLMLAGIQTAGIAATDALAMFKTAAVDNSVIEMCVGGLIFAGVHEIVNSAARALFKKRDPEKRLKALERLPYVTVYHKGIGKTRLIVPTGNEIGRGCHGVAYAHRDDPRLVVKKSEEDLVEEFETGYILNHPNINPTHHLYIKVYDVLKEQFKYKIEMEKVAGQTFTELRAERVSLSNEKIKQLIQETKKTCLYLFENGYVWGDMNPGNIMVDDNGLKLIDFGYWHQEPDSTERTKGLLLGAMQILQNILACSEKYLQAENQIIQEYPQLEGITRVTSQYYSNYRELITLINEMDSKIDEVYQQLINQVVYPKSVFRQRDSCNELPSIRHGDYSYMEPMRTLFSQFPYLNDKGKARILNLFFDSAIREFENRFNE